MKFGDFADELRADQITFGCAGIVCILTGAGPHIHNGRLGAIKTLDFSNCYKDAGKALQEQKQMEQSDACCSSGKNIDGLPAKPVIFSIHLWAAEGDLTDDPRTSKTNIQKLLNKPEHPKPKHPKASNFGVAYFNGLNGDEKGGDDTLTGGNFGQGGGRGERLAYDHGMKLQVWMKDWTPDGSSNYNTELWCVTCDGNKMTDAAIKPYENLLK